MTRYTVTTAPDGQRFGIWDEVLGWYCALPDHRDPSTLAALEWKRRAGAERWLMRCYRTWAAQPEAAPDGWHPFQPRLTLRVSHDSGRTWGPERTVTPADDLPPLMTSAWPVCECWRCEGRQG